MAGENNGKLFKKGLTDKSKETLRPFLISLVADYTHKNHIGTLLRNLTLK